MRPRARDRSLRASRLCRADRPAQSQDASLSAGVLLSSGSAGRLLSWRPPLCGADAQLFVARDLSLLVCVADLNLSPRW